MSIELTLLCNNSTITTEVHSRIETQLYTFTYRNTTLRLKQSSGTEFTQQSTNSSTMSKEQFTTCNLEERAFLTVQRKLKVGPPLFPSQLNQVGASSPPHCIPLARGTLAFNAACL